MNLTLIGLFINFVGAFAIILETISGFSIRSKIYYFVLRRVYQFTGDHTPPVKIKLMPKEVRVLIWIILVIVGFSFQILGYFYK